ncbi:putative UPF0481 protein At3g02645 [Cryptomeria japonica]|uniref:putative UPF0481 protein At3g02645 n=1 Tax=Cryptomeria japonica TaxID=3369 RepID=UPI0027D9DEA0|nr:putative UPF0481 protein At3g02645 [Cryptomeria japonica]
MPVPKVGVSQWLEIVKNTQKHGEEQGIISHDHPYIFTVPETLRIERPEAYLPQVASLGPYHHLELKLYEAERYKSRLAIEVEKTAEKSFEDLVNEIIRMGADIRNCYNDPIQCNNEELGWMMARDAVFILKFIDCYNQCPNPKFEQETGSESQELDDKLKDRIAIACKCFSPFIDVVTSINVGDTNHDSHRSIACDGRHILECLYNSVVPKKNAGHTDDIVDQKRNMEKFKSFHCFPQITSRFKDFLHPKSHIKSGKNLPSATELHRRGVKFAPFTWARTSEEIRFDRASSTLFLPCIEMDYRTDVFLRNMVAVEAFMMCKTRVFTCYVDLMDRLIDTPNDVAVLKMYGIICSDLGSDKEISILWNGIRRSVWRSAYEPIDQTIKDLNAYYRSRYGVLLGQFFREHFSNSWRAASVVGACTLLVLAFL